ncbi:hypothetical protein [Spirosoma radiotolerans]|uniref:Secretion system C-terminal sorting domain-containing protein n=1 Tax=Spirosoma radiotolerans TaxID=1379870 RepID=A0A0E3ZRK5_9BACT|nr:hypothetical protein [Spirosoma radiotolerans]AKD53848.1 hypothetical protein SD10_01935 [Spirosoma radiotolerans]
MEKSLHKSQQYYIDSTQLVKFVNCLSQVTLLLIIASMLSCTAVSTHTLQRVSNNRNTELAHFQVSAYLMANGTKLRVSVDKQMGGKVTIQFVNSVGDAHYQLTLLPQDTVVRFNLNLTELDDGDYVLKVSNGLEMESRQVKIATSKPTIPVRQITIL